ncbi:MAG: hypothetical protein M1823_004283 [Watsoniomyces obsoletus]|nr:MAG: hypothetical protein M1823_004283 [Watsoniomyces obsoletus]
MDSLNIPTKGQWPADPQEDIPISKDRIWIDGCFDFSHHGHAGAMLQARRLGKELIVGIHSDEEIMDNKGPTVMTLKERISAVSACRWSSAIVPHAPYVTSLPWISHYGCHYVVHGDDITSDSTGQDCYRYVKSAGRFLVVKRTPGISTTDLVGRMLLYSKEHFIHSFSRVLRGEEGLGSATERKQRAENMREMIEGFASNESGLGKGAEVWSWIGPNPHNEHNPDITATASGDDTENQAPFTKLVTGIGPKEGQRIIYVDGGFDLFSSGHIEFLKLVHEAEEQLGQERGWEEESSKKNRIEKYGENYRPAFIVAGIHDDETVNRWKGANYPIMNIFERGLCVLQCKYIQAIIFSAPFIPTAKYLELVPYGDGIPARVYHGPTNPVLHTRIPPTILPPLSSSSHRDTNTDTVVDVYRDAKMLGIYKEIPRHDYQNVNAEMIVQRILMNRKAYEERQRMKAAKSAVEDVIKKGDE